MTNTAWSYTHVPHPMFVLNNKWPYPMVPHGMSILTTMITTWSYTLVTHGMFILTNVINKLVPYKMESWVLQLFKFTRFLMKFNKT
jgi:hypothetical protein